MENDLLSSLKGLNLMWFINAELSRRWKSNSTQSRNMNIRSNKNIEYFRLIYKLENKYSLISGDLYLGFCINTGLLG